MADEFDDKLNQLMEAKPAVSRVMAARAAARVLPLTVDNNVKPEAVLAVWRGVGYALSSVNSPYQLSIALTAAVATIPTSMKFINGAAAGPYWGNVGDAAVGAAASAVRAAIGDTVKVPKGNMVTVRDYRDDRIIFSDSTDGSATAAALAAATAAARAVGDPKDPTAGAPSAADGDALDAARAVRAVFKAAWQYDGKAFLKNADGPTAWNARLWNGTDVQAPSAWWDRARRDLKAWDQGWDVWIGWYQSLLDGTYDDTVWTAAFNAMEESDWDAGDVAAINQKLRNVLEKFSPEGREDSDAQIEVPQDRAGTYAFEPGPDGRIVPKLNRHTELDCPDAQGAYDHLKSVLDEIIEGLSASNHPGLAAPFRRLLEGLGPSLDELKTGDVAAVISAIEAIIARYGLLGDRNELDDGLQATLVEVGGRLGHLLIAIPAVRVARDEIAMARVDPQNIPAIVEKLHAIRDVAAAHPEIVTGEAVDAITPPDDIQDQIENLPFVTDEAAKASLNDIILRMTIAAQFTTANFLNALLRSAKGPLGREIAILLTGTLADHLDSLAERSPIFSFFSVALSRFASKLDPR